MHRSKMIIVEYKIMCSLFKILLAIWLYGGCIGMSSIENCYAVTLRTITTAQTYVQRQDSLVCIVKQNYRLYARSV